MDVQLEQRVIRKASELFLSHGIKAITMDYIAREVGISKRTLYQLFADKDALLQRTLEYQEQQSETERKKLAAECSNSFEYGIMEYEYISRNLRNVNRNYIRDLQRYHPNVAVFLEKKRQATTERIVCNMEEGMREGYIRPELNSRILALLLRVQLEELMTSEEIEKNHYSFTEVFDTIVLSYARGIATPKGLRLLEERVTHENNK